LVLFLRACQMIGIRVAGERELLGIAQGANVCTRRDGIVCPLAAGVLRVADSDVGDGLVGLVAPLNARGGIDFGVGIRSDEGIEQCVDGQGLGRVAQRRQKVGVEVVGQVQQVGLAAELRVEEGVMVAADIVGDMSMQDVRQDERRGAVPCGGLAIGVAGRRSKGEGGAYQQSPCQRIAGASEPWTVAGGRGHGEERGKQQRELAKDLYMY
jgi:hypothetical protein